MGKDKSDRAKKGAQTRALNAQIEQEEAQRLALRWPQCEEGCPPNLDVVWKRNVDKRAVSPLAYRIILKHPAGKKS